MVLRAGFGIFTILTLAACASHSGRDELYSTLEARPRQSHFLIQTVRAGCPAPGMPTIAVRAALGEPDMVLAGVPGQTRWLYHLDRDGPRLAVAIAGDTVSEWTANPYREWGRVPWARGGGPSPDDAARVNAYLKIHPDLEPAVVFALARGCPQLGMPPELVQVALGAPVAVDTAWFGPHKWVRWTYGYGVEGQGEQFGFVADSLVTTWSCGGLPSPTCESTWGLGVTAP